MPGKLFAKIKARLDVDKDGNLDLHDLAMEVHDLMGHVKDWKAVQHVHELRNQLWGMIGKSITPESKAAVLNTIETVAISVGSSVAAQVVSAAEDKVTEIAAQVIVEASEKASEVVETAVEAVVAKVTKKGKK